MKYKMLFFHNSLPEYRMLFWKYLAKYINYKLFITNEGLEKQIYNFDNCSNEIQYEYYTKSNKRSILNSINSSTLIVLPPIDTIHEYLIAKELIKTGKKQHAIIVCWSEKWEAKWKNQPIKKKIKNYIHRYMYKNVFEQSARCICSGRKSREYAEMLGIKDEKISVCYDSSTSQLVTSEVDLRKQYHIPKEKRIILFMGRLIRRKGCDVLINAFLKLNIKDVVLIIAGDGEELDNYKRLSNNNKSIIYTGMISPKERRNYYNQVDVFVLPSICYKGIIEAWGLTVNEALECGTPVIATDAVGAAYDLITGDSGIVVKNNSEYELLNALKKILNKNYDREKIKDQYKRFNVENMSKTFYEALNFEMGIKDEYFDC